MYTRKKRVLAFVIALFLVLCSGSEFVSAKEIDQQTKSEGICEHHTEHTEECGYETEGGCSYQCEICSSGENKKEGKVKEGETKDNTSFNEAKNSAKAASDKADQTVTDWSWNDSEEVFVWSKENKRWEAAFPGVSEEQPLTAEALGEMLPQSVTAEIDGEKKEVAVTWDLSAMPESTSNGEYTISAELEDGYTLAAEADTLSAAVVLDEKASTMALDQNILNQHKVATASDEKLENVQIDLFDYWITPQQNEPDNYAEYAYEYTPGRKYAYDYDYAADWTGWDWDSDYEFKNFEHYDLENDNPTIPNKFPLNIKTETELGPYRDRLKELFYGAAGNEAKINAYNGRFKFNVGYGAGHDLNSDNSAGLPGIVQDTLDSNGYPRLSEKYDSGSLDYLFNMGTYDGKAAYQDVKGLLYYEDGNYAYDSTDNSAFFDEESKRFQVYDTPVVHNGVGEKIAKQFFPFNTPKQLLETRNGALISKDISQYETPLNHHFGLHMNTEFQQPTNGMVGDGADKKAMKFGFSGDDDVWIYVDGVLVADLGGIHDAISTEIDFVTGEITVGGVHKGYLRTILEQNGVTAGVSGNTLTDGSIHTLDFFYLERGNSASNMKLSFNLQAPAYNYIKKIDQDGKPMSGLEFKLYDLGDSLDKTKDGNLVFTGTSNANGQIQLIDNEKKKPLGLSEGHYYRLEETDPPDGYIATGDGSGKVYLQYVHDELEVVTESQWTTGTDTTLSAIVTSDSIYKTDSTGSNMREEISSTNGIIVAVPLLNKNRAEGDVSETNNWCPLYGNPEEGFQMVETTDATQMADIKKAVINQKDYGNWYLTYADGLWEGELEGIPGKASRYYYLNTDKGDLYMAYYFVEGVRDPAQITESTPVNDFTLLFPGSFERNFSSVIEVPNLVRELQVIKKNADGDSLPGATFGIYNNEDCTGDPLISGITDKDGIVSFSANNHRIGVDEKVTEDNREGHVIYALTPKADGENKDLYIKEIKAPDRYACNSTIIHVVVTKDSVYAYAGDENSKDGVSVRKGLGKLANNMMQYASDDAVNSTLRDITLTGHLQKEKEFVDWGNWPETGESKHLHYGLTEVGANTNAWGYGYATHGESGETGPMPYLETESGWLGFSAKQDLTTHASEDDTFKETITSDITNLFSGATGIIVEDKEATSLTVEKTVTNLSTGTDSDSYAFTAELSQEAAAYASQAVTFTVTGLPEGGNITDIVPGATGATGETVDGKTIYSVNTDKDGKLSFALKHGQKVTFNNLPVGLTAKLTEAAGGYTTDVKVGTGAATDASEYEVTLTEALTTVTFSNTLLDPFKFQKTDSEDKGLGGAKFVLYEKICEQSQGHDHSDILKVNAEGKLTNEADKACWKQVGEATSVETTGLVEFGRLSTGAKEYRLIEYKAPGGYILPNGQWTISYNETSKKFVVPENSAIGNPPAFEEVNDGAAGVPDGVSYRVKNYRPDELPFTGNTGIKMILLVGLVMMVIGGIGTIRYYQKKRRVLCVQIRQRKR